MDLVLWDGSSLNFVVDSSSTIQHSEEPMGSHTSWASWGWRTPTASGTWGGYSQVLERFMFELDHGFLLHRPTEAHDHGEKDSYPDISGIFVDCITSKSAISPSISDTMVTSLLGMRQSSW